MNIGQTLLHNAEEGSLHFRKKAGQTFRYLRVFWHEC